MEKQDIFLMKACGCDLLEKCFMYYMYFSGIPVGFDYCSSFLLASLSANAKAEPRSCVDDLHKARYLSTLTR